MTAIEKNTAKQSNITMLWQFNGYIFCKQIHDLWTEIFMSPSERKIIILQLRHILRSVLNGEACLVCLDKRFVLNVNRDQRPSRNAVKKI